MTLSRRLLSMSLLILCLPCLARAQSQETGDRGGFVEKYKIIVDRNIFSRDRRPYQKRQDRPANTQASRPTPPVEAGYVLKGLTREHQQTTAFIETLNTGVIERYVLGSPVARGRIKSLTLDLLEYVLPVPKDPNDPNDVNVPKVTQVRIGQTLLGQPAGPDLSLGTLLNDLSSAPSPAAGTAETRPTSTPSPGGGAAESEILRQLMERRKKELGQ